MQGQMGWIVLPDLFIWDVGSMLYQLIKPGAKSDNNLIDESYSNKPPA